MPVDIGTPPNPSPVFLLCVVDLGCQTLAYNMNINLEHGTSLATISVVLIP